jgi:hypothetical protein
MIMHRANLATALPSYSVRDGAGDMSIHRYVTGHVNEVQQLSVTVSKHLMVLKDGRLKGKRGLQAKAAFAGVA